MNDKWLDFAIRIQSIAQAGLQYGKDKFDKERYQELREIAAEKEVKEEAGLDVTAEKLIAVQDWRKHNVTNYANFFNDVNPKDISNIA